MDPMTARTARSLRTSLVLYVAFFALLALLLSTAAEALCNAGIHAIWNSYPPDSELYYLTNQQGERLGEGTYISKDSRPMTERDQHLVALLDLVSLLAPPVCSSICILAAALLFYRNRLKYPLAQLREASEKIAANDLNFSVCYDRSDELGLLCASFERMRSTLAENLSRMWRQAEDRKRLNAAFAHDLRTPLTVLKGCSEMLLVREEPEVRETAGMMARNLLRLERYVESMSSLQRLEDLRPCCREIALSELAASLCQTGEMVCQGRGKKLLFQNRTTSPSLPLDPELIAEVWGNLSANGARYAREQLALTLWEEEDGLFLSVEDDGPGFPPGDLDRVAEPWFTGEEDRSEHFGLGLSICRILCQRHGGWLRPENGAAGGARVTAFFRSVAEETS